MNIRLSISLSVTMPAELFALAIAIIDLFTG